MIEATNGTPEYDRLQVEIVKNLRPKLGDPRTIGMHIKLVGSKLTDDNWKGGIYGGQVEGKHAIVRAGILFDIEAVELFDTVEEMQARWEVD